MEQAPQLILLQLQDKAETGKKGSIVSGSRYPCPRDSTAKYRFSTCTAVHLLRQYTLHSTFKGSPNTKAVHSSVKRGPSL